MTKPAVLLIHSGGFTSRQWRKLGEALSPRYDVLAPDLIGYGAEPWPNGKPFHFGQDVAFLESLLDERGEPAHLVGHSYGGFLAFKLALKRPELVRSIAAYEPVTFGVLDETADADVISALALVRQQWEPDASGADEAWLRDFVDWWNGSGTWSRLGSETRAGMCAVGWKVFQEVITLAADRTDRATYGTIAVPTLVMAGENTQPAERRVVENLAAALPHASARVFPAMGHMGPISHAPIVNAAIVAHVDGV
jgi:pimeloyl-ACP methyl ester carboxylesterase